MPRHTGEGGCGYPQQHMQHTLPIRSGVRPVLAREAVPQSYHGTELAPWSLFHMDSMDTESQEEGGESLIMEPSVKEARSSSTAVAISEHAHDEGSQDAAKLPRLRIPLGGGGAGKVGGAGRFAALPRKSNNSKP